MGKKISFFTSPIGLGHASRDAAIAPHLAGAEATVSFTTGGAAARLLGKREAPYKTCTIPKVQRGLHNRQAKGTLKVALELLQVL